MARNMTLFVLLILVLFRLEAAAQNRAAAPCQLDEANNGKEVSLSGTVLSAPHDLIFSVPGCKEVVVVEFPEDGSRGASSSRARGRDNISIFQRYSSLEAKCPPGERCMERPAYTVEATLNGRLEVGIVPDGYWKDGLGYLHDSTGKITGKYGFGHPPTFKYRLVVESIPKVAVRKKQWRGQATDPKSR